MSVKRLVDSSVIFGMHAKFLGNTIFEQLAVTMNMHTQSVINIVLLANDVIGLKVRQTIA